MIRMIENPAELAGEDITGKYILRKLNYHWFAYGKAAIVTRLQGNDPASRTGRDGLFRALGSPRLYGQRQTLSRRHLSHSAVACVCDTPDDVNAVIQLDVEAQDEFYQLIAKAEARVQALASSSRNSQFLEAAE